MFTNKAFLVYVYPESNKYSLYINQIFPTPSNTKTAISVSYILDW